MSAATAETARVAGIESLLRLPSLRPQKGRQAIRGVDGEDGWAGADEDFARAVAFSPASFTWVRAKTHLVELPALWVRLPLRNRDPAELADELSQTLSPYSVPEPHFVVADGVNLVALWRIKSLLRPAPGRPPQHHAAFAGALEAWRRCTIKLALACAPLGARQLDVALVDDHLTGFVPLPLDPASPLTEHVGLQGVPVLVRATPADTVLIADVSKPLQAFDAAMFRTLGIEPPRGRKRWLSTPRSLAAATPKGPGERHPAALDIVCAARWDGESDQQMEARLREWAATCVQDGQFPDRYATSDEIADLVAWAMKKLEPGGPSIDANGARRTRRTSVDDVADAVKAFLAHLGGRFDGAKQALAKQVALWRAEKGDPKGCPLRTLKRALTVLKAAGAVLHEVIREGRTWASTWRLDPAAGGATLASRGQEGESSWAPAPVLTFGEGAAGERLLPAGGVEGGVSDTADHIQTIAAAEQNVVSAESPPENDPPRPRRRRQRKAVAGHRQQRLLLPRARPTPRKRSTGTEGKGLPPITDELLAELADVAPSLSASERRELLELARSKLRPRPAVLANFARYLRRRAERIRAKQVGASMPEPQPPPRHTPSPAPASPSPADAATLSEFRRMLALNQTPFHDRPVADRARRLHDEGVSLLPLLPASKRPALPEWREYQHERMSMTLLRRRLELAGEGAGLAVICGSVSDLVVADLDDEAAVAWARKHLPETPWRTKTRRGEHWYYRPGKTWVPSETVPWTGSVQAEGRYVVAPGSTHPDTGEVYVALGDWSQPRLALPTLEARHLIDVDVLRATRARILREDK